MLVDQSGEGRSFRILKKVKLRLILPVFLKTAFVLVATKNDVSPLTIAGVNL